MMIEDLKILEEMTKEYNRLTDEAISAVGRLENHLRAIGVGVEAIVPINTECKLIYTRANKTFRICIKTLDGAETPWDSCTREMKLATLPLMSQLVKELLSRVTDLLTAAKHNLRLSEINQCLPSE